MLNNNIRRCNHNKTNGIQCGSPALRNSDFCYFHRKARRDFPTRQVTAPLPAPVIDLTLIDDPDAIHYALMQVMQAILNRTITHKDGWLLVQCLQTMSSNFKRTSFQRQLEDEYNKSNLNAYELWDKYAKIREQEQETRLHEKRVEELKRIERTCSKCKKEAETTAPSPAPNPASSNEAAPDTNHHTGDSTSADAVNSPTSLNINACSSDAARSDHQIIKSTNDQLLRASDHHLPQRLASSTLRLTLCDPDSLPSSAVPTQANQRC